MSESTLIDHEKRLTAMEITSQSVVNSLNARLAQLEAIAQQQQAAEAEALQRHAAELEAQVKQLQGVIDADTSRRATTATARTP